MPDIIIVEDNREIGTLLCDFLRKENYTVSLVDTGEKALQIFEQYGANLVVIDIGLPGVDGYSVCSKIRETSNAHIMIATARDDKESTLKGLQIGADDYITKPFSMEELTFRIEAILRRVRGKKNKESNIYKIGMFTFDTQKQILSTPEKQTKLTTKESELLGLLCAHANEILQRDFALKTIWIDDNYFNARSMDVYITKLRKHLKR